MKITEPKLVRKNKENYPLVYYTVYVWADEKAWGFIDGCYQYASEAINCAKRHIKSGMAYANVREEKVYHRTEESELSMSTVIFSINKKGETE